MISMNNYVDRYFYVSICQHLDCMFGPRVLGTRHLGKTHKAFTLNPMPPLATLTGVGNTGVLSLRRP